LTDLRVGQVWEDTHRKLPRWTVKIVKVNPKSVRVERCEDHGVFLRMGPEWQYPMERGWFNGHRMRLLQDVLDA
jgi:hypothetical protein